MTLAQFVGVQGAVVSGDVMRTLASPGVLNAYHEYLRLMAEWLQFKGNENVRGSRVRSAVCASAMESLAVKSDVSVNSSASSGRAFERAKQSAQGSDVTYSAEEPSVVLGDGFCYLALIKAECADMVAQDLGPNPTFQKLLELPLQVLVEEWVFLKVSGNHGVYHLARQGMVSALDCFPNVAIRGGAWPDGSFGASLAGREVGEHHVLRRKAPALTDVLAGRYEGRTSVGRSPPNKFSLRSGTEALQVPKQLSLAERFEHMASLTPRMVSLQQPFEVAYGSAAGHSYAVVFVRDKPRGFLPLQGLSVDYVKQVAYDTLTSEGGVRLVCFDAEGADLHKAELTTLTTWSVSISKLWKLACDQRTLNGTAENLKRHTYKVFSAWGTHYPAMLDAVSRPVDAELMLFSDWLERNEWARNKCYDVSMLSTDMVKQFQSFGLRLLYGENAGCDCVKVIALLPLEASTAEAIARYQEVGMMVMKCHPAGWIVPAGLFHSF
jgi:hypothetical protein